MIDATWVRCGLGVIVGVAPGWMAMMPTDAAAVVNGDAAPVSISGSIASLSSGCTGTLVHPQWVLTAWHCADATNPGSVSVMLGDGSETRNVTAIRGGPDDPWFYNDLALWHLDRPSNQPVVPIASPAEQAAWHAEPDEDVYAIAVGWGYTACTQFGPDGCIAGPVPQLRPELATVRIDPENPDDPNRDKKIEVSAGSGYVCDIDSGSPLLIGEIGGRVAVAGVLSYADCVGTGGYVKVGEGVNRSWLRAQLRAPHGSVDFDGDAITDVFTSAPGVGGFAAATSSGGAGNWASMPDPGRPVHELRFGDFDGDGVTDLFAVTPDAGGSRWRYSSAGRGPWVPLAWDRAPLSALRFGDFDGDGRTDVFYAAPRHDGLFQWRYSPGGVGNWVDLAVDQAPPAELRFGDFDGDGRTDVFHAVAVRVGRYQWRYASAGLPYSQKWVSLAHDTAAPADLRLGDFDGDGRTDVFHAKRQTDGSWQWRFSPGGKASWVNLASATEPAGELRLGDFDGDAITDVFTAVPDEGGFQWRFSRSGRDRWVDLAWAYEPLSALRVGDLYGQG